MIPALVVAPLGSRDESCSGSHGTTTTCVPTLCAVRHREGLEADHAGPTSRREARARQALERDPGAQERDAVAADPVDRGRRDPIRREVRRDANRASRDAPVTRVDVDLGVDRIAEQCGGRGERRFTVSGPSSVGRRLSSAGRAGRRTTTAAVAAPRISDDGQQSRAGRVPDAPPPGPETGLAHR